MSHSESSSRVARRASPARNAALFFAIVGPALGASFAQAQSQAYPNRPIRLIVPYPPGASSNDILGRGIALRLTNVLGQQVVVDNRSGASGTLGSEIAARSAPDGYTLLMAVAGPISVGPSVYPNLTYDPVRDFAPVAVFATVPYVMTVGPSVPATNIKELIALAKAKPGQLTFGSSGNGGSPHLCGELFKTMAGVDMIHIPYKGGALAVADVVGGRVQMLCTGMVALSGHIKSGKLRAIGMATLERSAALPDLPSISEQGLKGFDVNSWSGIIAPAKTPRAIVNRLYEATEQVVKSPEFVTFLEGQGAEPLLMKPEQFAAYIKVEVARWGKVVRAAKVTAE